MKLIVPTMEYDRQIQAFRQEYLEDGGSMDGSSSLRKYPCTQDWLDQIEPLTAQYIYVREEDDTVVGLIQIRQHLNAYLSQYAGHIGYCVRPSERRKGCATRMLAAVLPECMRLGISDVLVCCLVDNVASRKTILRNGGIMNQRFRILAVSNGSSGIGYSCPAGPCTPIPDHVPACAAWTYRRPVLSEMLCF